MILFWCLPAVSINERKSNLFGLTASIARSTFVLVDISLPVINHQTQGSSHSPARS